MRAVFLASILAASVLPPAAQTPTAPVARPPARGYVVERWNTDAGLPQVSGSASLRPAGGSLWVGSLGGIARFDGTNFRTIPPGDQAGLLSDRAYALAEGT